MRNVDPASDLFRQELQARNELTYCRLPGLKYINFNKLL